jgi:CHAT domain-containing protein/Tfp pilus assembly protein PilF
MPRLRRLVWLAVLPALPAVTAMVPGPLRAASTQVLPLGRSGAERALPRNAVHAYLLDLRAGEYVHLRADQNGVDIELRMLGPTGRLLVRVDSPNGDHGPEDLYFLAATAGRHRAEVALRGGPAGGRYRIALLARRPATAADRRRAAALLAFSRAAGLEAAGAAGQAAAGYQRSASLWQGLGEEGRRAEALRNQARTRLAAGALQEALHLYEEACRAFQAAGDRHGQALMLNEMGRCAMSLSHPAEARALFERALALWPTVRETANEARSWQNLAQLDLQQGSFTQALDALGHELTLWERLGDRAQQAGTLASTGLVLAEVGEGAAALERCQRALALLSAPGGDRELRARTLAQLANAFFAAGAPRSAVLPLSAALGLQRKTGDLRGQAVTLASLGRVYFKLGDQRRAADLHRKALDLFRRVGEATEEATAWSNLGWIAWVQKRPWEALASFGRALPLARAHGYRELEAAALHGMARAELQRGNPIAARKRIEEALSIIESIRGEFGHTELQLSYFAKKEDYYGFLIDLLMEQHRLQPAAGHDLRALEASEKARARNLLDRVPSGGRPSLPLTLREIQGALDRGTLLLELYLSEPSSYLWVVSSDAVASYELPGGARIERQVLDLQAALTRRGAGHGVAGVRLAELGRSLLGPVAGELGNKRLLIVAHGILQRVPFSALLPPVAGSGAQDKGSPLLVRHEITLIPSASVLVALRRRAGGRDPAPEELAVLADPVFSREDSRLPARRSAPAAVGWLGGQDLTRLQFAGAEADAILKLASPRSVLRALGFAARRDLVLSGLLGRYRILHFATHGLFDEENPEHSALVLSRFDSLGRPCEGLVRPPEIEGLHLSADLVVLSACRTALGRQIRGEGLVGLTRSFFVAGASRVLVSLWNVDDRATSVLMERFYRALLRDGRSPSAALRDAQLSMWRDARWREPYHWAGFQVEGDWN